MSKTKRNGMKSVMGQLNDFVEAQYLAAETKRRAKGCVEVVALCRIAEHPEAVSDELRQHIPACTRCKRLYEAILKGYPHLQRPSWGNFTERSKATG